MLEVRQRGSDAPQQPGDAPGHSQLLELRLELDRLDPVRDELGPAGDRAEAELLAPQGGQPPEQVLDVRLVAGPLPAEHVGVDDDERLDGALLGHVRGLTPDMAHPAASSYTRHVSAATRSQVNMRARSSPRATSSSRREKA